VALFPHPGSDDGATLSDDLEQDPWRASRLITRPAPGYDVHEWSQLNWLSGSELAAGMPTAQETMKAFQRERLAPALREIGFQGSASKFRLMGSDPAGYVGVRRDRKHSNRLVVTFTLGLSIGWPFSEARWSTSLAYLLHEAGQRDIEWRLPAGAETTDLLEDVVSSLCTYGLPVLKAAIRDVRDLSGIAHHRVVGDRGPSGGPYAPARTLATQLFERGQIDWAQDIEEAISGGSTSKEIAERLRSRLEQLLGSGVTTEKEATGARCLVAELNAVLG
jgi:hypothetical protein